MTRVWRDYRDQAHGGLFDRTDEPASKGLLPARLKPVEDAPTPSPNGVAGIVLGRLAELTGEPIWRERAAELLRAFAAEAGTLGLHVATYLSALDWHLSPAVQFVVVGEEGDPLAARMHSTALATYAPRRVAQRITAGTSNDRALPAAMVAMLDRSRVPAGYACLGAACKVPAMTESAWEETLLSVRPEVRLSAP